MVHIILVNMAFFSYNLKKRRILFCYSFYSFGIFLSNTFESCTFRLLPFVSLILKTNFTTHSSISIAVLHSMTLFKLQDEKKGPSMDFRNIISIYIAVKIGFLLAAYVCSIFILMLLFSQSITCLFFHCCCLLQNHIS